jgi:hypothetical protein
MNASEFDESSDSSRRWTPMNADQGYLKATGLKVCLLVNFGVPKATVKRVVYGF